MSDAKSPSDLSIDEILTTIRRIITEDEEASAAEADGGAATDASSGAAPSGGSSAAPVSRAAAERTDIVDDVLELTEALNDDGTTRHLAPLGGSSRRPAAAPASQPEAPRSQVPSAPPGAAPTRLPRDLALGAGGRTLEDIVGDLLRPMLQSWLDDNLPPLVERLVQAEVARAGRAAGAD